MISLIISFVYSFLGSDVDVVSEIDADVKVEVDVDVDVEVEADADIEVDVGAAHLPVGWNAFIIFRASALAASSPTPGSLFE